MVVSSLRFSFPLQHGQLPHCTIGSDPASRSTVLGSEPGRVPACAPAAQSPRSSTGLPVNGQPLQSENQICNNFARKSVRGFFHDFMSSAIDGSILAETNVSINFGLCRWSQCVLP